MAYHITEEEFADRLMDLFSTNTDGVDVGRSDRRAASETLESVTATSRRSN